MCDRLRDMTQHLIVGAGEVGTALQEVLSTWAISLEESDASYIIDSDPSNTSQKIPPVDWKPNVLHIAFPYSHRFIVEVGQYIGIYDPDLIVVHSTVPVDTCWKLPRRQDVVHSPIRGRHPHLAESIRTFVKHFGGPRADEAAVHFSVRGIETSTTYHAANTEAGKLWEMVQFAVNIAMEKEITRYCEAHGMARDVVYTEFAATYNEGYADLDLYQFVRPILEHMPGPIGGHCVMPSLEWLSFSNPGFVSQLQDWLSDLTSNGQDIAPGTLEFPDQDVANDDPEVDRIIRGWLTWKSPTPGDASHAIPEEMTQRWPGSSLEDTDPNLISQLKVMGDNWGPLGVARTAALLTDTDLLIKGLTGRIDSPDQCSPYCAGGHTVGCPNNTLPESNQ